MNRDLLLSLLLLTACALDVRATQPAPLAVLSGPRAVRLDEPVVFHREAARLPSVDGVLMTIAAPDLLNYLATAITPPLVVYGSGACLQLAEPSGPARVDVLCPPLAASDEPIVWLTLPGAFEKHLTSKRVISELAQARKTRRAVPVTPPSAGEPDRFKGLPELRASLKKASTEAPDAGPR